MSQEKYIGMDVHAATISAAVKNAEGKLLMECVLETKAATILEFIQGLRGPFNINIPSDYFWSAGRAGRFGLGDDWQIRLRGRIRAGLCGRNEDTDCCKISITLIDFEKGD